MSRAEGSLKVKVRILFPFSTALKDRSIGETGVITQKIEKDLHQRLLSGLVAEFDGLDEPLMLLEDGQDPLGKECRHQLITLGGHEQRGRQQVGVKDLGEGVLKESAR